jgi:hypothetical protein
MSGLAITYIRWLWRVDLALKTLSSKISIRFMVGCHLQFCSLIFRSARGLLHKKILSSKKNIRSMVDCHHQFCSLVFCSAGGLLHKKIPSSKISTRSMVNCHLQFCSLIFRSAGGLPQKMGTGRWVSLGSEWSDPTPVRQPHPIISSCKRTGLDG